MFADKIAEPSDSEKKLKNTAAIKTTITKITFLSLPPLCLLSKVPSFFIPNINPH